MVTRVKMGLLFYTFKKMFAQTGLISLILVFLSTQGAHAVRIKDIADIEGVRKNQLIGYGLVVGLDGTGDGNKSEFTLQSMSSMLEKMGIKVDPRDIDADLVINIASWVLIEILKESNVKNPENTIKLLFRKKIPLVQEVEDILHTTHPKLTGPQRILLILYSAQTSLSEEQIFSGVKLKIKNKDHLRKSLQSLEKREWIHQKKNNSWMIFGRGILKAEEVIQKFK